MNIKRGDVAALDRRLTTGHQQCRRHHAHDAHPQEPHPLSRIDRAGFPACTDFSTRAGFTRSDSLVRVIRLARVGFFTRLDFFERIAVLLI